MQVSQETRLVLLRASMLLGMGVWQLYEDIICGRLALLVGAVVFILLAAGDLVAASRQRELTGAHHRK